MRPSASDNSRNRRLSQGRVLLGTSKPFHEFDEHLTYFPSSVATETSGSSDHARYLMLLGCTEERTSVRLPFLPQEVQYDDVAILTQSFTGVGDNLRSL